MELVVNIVMSEWLRNQRLKGNADLQLQWSCELSGVLGSVSHFPGIMKSLPTDLGFWTMFISIWEVNM